MKLLRCKYCRGEVDIIGNEHSVNKKVKCQQCNFTNADSVEHKEPEVVIIRKRPGQ